MPEAPLLLILHEADAQVRTYRCRLLVRCPFCSQRHGHTLQTEMDGTVEKVAPCNRKSYSITATAETATTYDWLTYKRLQGPTGPGPCPRCGAETRLVKGRHGPFYGCSGWPECAGSRAVATESRVLQFRRRTA